MISINSMGFDDIKSDDSEIQSSIYKLGLYLKMIQLISPMKIDDCTFSNFHEKILYDCKNVILLLRKYKHHQKKINTNATQLLPNFSLKSN